MVAGPMKDALNKDGVILLYRCIMRAAFQLRANDKMYILESKPRHGLNTCPSMSVMGLQELRLQVPRAANDLPDVAFLPPDMVFTQASLRHCIRENFKRSKYSTDPQQLHNLGYSALEAGSFLNLQLMLHARSSVSSTSVTAMLPQQATSTHTLPGDGVEAERQKKVLDNKIIDRLQYRNPWDTDDDEVKTGLVIMQKQTAARQKFLRDAEVQEKLAKYGKSRWFDMTFGKGHFFPDDGTSEPDADEEMGDRDRPSAISTADDFEAVAVLSSVGASLQHQLDEVVRESDSDPAKWKDMVHEPENLLGSESSPSTFDAASGELVECKASLNVHVTSFFVDDTQLKEPLEFSCDYRVVFENTGTHPIQVLGRAWIIKDAWGVQKVGSWQRPAYGVLNQQPVVMPGSSVSYSSCCWLHSREGTMSGSFYCRVLTPTEGLQGERGMLTHRISFVDRSGQPVDPDKSQGVGTVPPGDPSSHFTAVVAPFKISVSASQSHLLDSKLNELSADAEDDSSDGDHTSRGVTDTDDSDSEGSNGRDDSWEKETMSATDPLTRSFRGSGDKGGNQ